MKRILIIGAGGHGRVVADIALRMASWQEIVFLDDDESLKSSMGFRVVGRLNEASHFVDKYEIFVAIGSNSIREKIQRQLKAAGAIIPTLIHPNATIGTHIEIGEGTVIMAGAVINCGSRIGEGCIVNTAASIDHDAIIKNYVHISPGAHLAGTVSIGNNSWVGIGAVVNNNINIAEKVIIGAGSVVIKNISEPGIFVGVPARKISNADDSAC